MDKLLEELIQNYERHLRAGERNLLELEIFKKKHSCEYKSQQGFIGFWKMAINDFRAIADMYKHELQNNKKKH